MWPAELRQDGKADAAAAEDRLGVFHREAEENTHTHTHVRICLCFLVFNMSWEALSAPPAVSDLRRGRAQFIKNGSRSQ